MADQQRGVPLRRQANDRHPGGGERIAVRYELVRNTNELLFVVRVHLTGDPNAVSQVRNLATQGVQQYLNTPGHMLPMVDLPMRVEVQFVDTPQAHLTVAVTGPNTQMDQAHWPQNQPPAFYAHEILHSLGAIDHRPPSPRTNNELHADLRTSLMSPPTPDSPMTVVREDLQQIMDTLAPIYAGVVGDHGPHIRPQGTASAAQGPSSVTASWESGQDQPPRMPDPISPQTSTDTTTTPDPQTTDEQPPAETTTTDRETTGWNGAG